MLGQERLPSVLVGTGPGGLVGVVSSGGKKTSGGDGRGEEWGDSKHTHAEAEVFVHLGGVSDEGVGHGDLVRGAGDGEDEWFFGCRYRGPEVALADNLVDVAKVLGERDG